MRHKVIFDAYTDTFSVYRTNKDGSDEWIANFLDRADAEMFALEKEKEELK